MGYPRTPESIAKAHHALPLYALWWQPLKHRHRVGGLRPSNYPLALDAPYHTDLVSSHHFGVKREIVSSFTFHSMRPTSVAFKFLLRKKNPFPLLPFLNSEKKAQGLLLMYGKKRLVMSRCIDIVMQISSTSLKKG
jgi:hypothetical protein